MNNPLRQLGNIPVTASVLESLFPHIRGGSQKLRLLERDKQIIRLKKGLYVCNPEITGKTLSTELIANHLYAPSYVSMSSALRYYGLIPEVVYTKQSMTLKYAKNFDTPFGRFEYTHISKAAFSVGLTSIKKEDYAFVMATPEKALCDLIANSSKVNLRYLKVPKFIWKRISGWKGRILCRWMPGCLRNISRSAKRPTQSVLYLNC